MNILKVITGALFLVALQYVLDLPHNAQMVLYSSLCTVAGAYFFKLGENSVK